MSWANKPNSKCPNCGHALQLTCYARKGESRAPKPNDLTICVDCLAVLVFTEAMDFRIAVRGDLSTEDRKELFKLQRELRTSGAFKN